MTGNLASVTEQPQSVAHRRGCLFYVKRGLLALVILVIVLPILGFTYETLMAPGDSARFPMQGERVDIGGYSLHLYCIGEGSPTLILEAGFGAWSTDWAVVQPDLSGMTRTCSYDRAGLGWSDAGPAPRDPQRIAAELHTLLTNASIEGPYVLVGQSIGGKHIRMFTELYPDEVAGLIFVDARHESVEPIDKTPEENQRDREAYESSLNLYRILRQFGIARIFGVSLSRTLVPGLENVGDDLVYENAIFGVRESTLQTMMAESPATTYSDDLLKHARLLGDLPVIVLTADSSLQLVEGWDVGQQNLAALSTNTRWTIVENTGHNIQYEQPAAVETAVSNILAAVRTGEPLAQ